jgi:hypothetical protein
VSDMFGEFGDDGIGGDIDGGVAALLIHKFRAKTGVKKMVGVSRTEWAQTKEKES